MEALRAVLLVLLLSGQSGSRWAQEEDGDVDVGSESYDYDDDYEEEEEEESNMVPDSRDRESLRCYICQSLHSGESCNQTRGCYHSRAFCTTLISHGNTDKGLLTTYSMWCTDTCQAFTRTVLGTQVTKSCCQSTLCNIPPWQSPQVLDSLGGIAGIPVDGGARRPQGGIAGIPVDGGARHPQGGRVGHPQVVKITHPQRDEASLPKGGRANKPQGSGAGCPPGWHRFGDTALLLSLLTSLWASGV
ncbi:glycosylphosphatidylinositol-anchored high density lipoprotein-binding protein 1 [Mesocricetus auratus]|uniref:Glycosylphosphatidylinositol-anchored high density lipoprotein-binding protein 1 n=1 Tax=Mesocricetus auratus TaxID=10036 RepID=A0A1U8CM58_MESAU|nr:glycosylphosphatidylinositol-anchored high density lipoprotein-binding protein 1 [Mesocricetus auratus]XP_012980596.1 glycosylphosphatidylinositol-anchored high density lipoprotein-binding protein 1 [Mesocricetus auratus]XP_021078673.1 glycosylphosphatidylinositol-anchored high density lipoprotein-binding protein 1 [Mesocricetus auratus]XP_021078674.1 glycosylphosphatidylinositol-anchored high density lipoprotein-binding protein 1 [Mesocricetus auratus]XP_040592336.1 glycosylphosphatidylinos